MGSWGRRVARAREVLAPTGIAWPGAAEDLASLEVEALSDLRGRDAHHLYQDLCETARITLPQATEDGLAALIRRAEAEARGPSAIEGPRLRLRNWRTPDVRMVGHLINQRPDAMRYFSAPLTPAENEAWCRRMRAHEEEHGWSFWVAEDHVRHVTVGVVGLLHVTFDAPFAPAIEVGWRIAPRDWRQGFAEEAARLSLDHGFGTLGLDRIVAFTPPENEASWRLMEKLGMRRAGEFEHPRIPEGHRWRHQFWYELRREDWRGLPPGWARVVRAGRTG